MQRDCNFMYIQRASIPMQGRRNWSGTEDAQRVVQWRRSRENFVFVTPLNESSPNDGQREVESCAPAKDYSKAQWWSVEAQNCQSNIQNHHRVCCRHSPNGDVTQVASGRDLCLLRSYILREVRGHCGLLNKSVYPPFQCLPPNAAQVRVLVVPET